MDRSTLHIEGVVFVGCVHFIHAEKTPKNNTHIWIKSFGKIYNLLFKKTQILNLRYIFYQIL